jgi:glycerophosphoryl diester phosphodiesterase
VERRHPAGVTFRWLDPPRIVGHRGNPAEATENTMAGFLAALDAGVRAVELDVRMTRDGELVVHHDAELGRVVAGHGLVEELRRDEIPALVPGLAEVLTRLPRDLLVDAEIKADAGNAEAVPAALLALVDACDARERVLVTSFAPELADAYAVLAHRPAGMILPFPPDAGELAAWPRLLFVMLAADAALPETLSLVRKEGGVPGVWTVNDADEAGALLAAGAACVITDRPRALARRLG